MTAVATRPIRGPGGPRVAAAVVTALLLACAAVLRLSVETAGAPLPDRLVSVMIGAALLLVGLLAMPRLPGLAWALVALAAPIAHARDRRRGALARDRRLRAGVAGPRADRRARARRGGRRGRCVREPEPGARLGPGARGDPASWAPACSLTVAAAAWAVLDAEPGRPAGDHRRAHAASDRAPDRPRDRGRAFAVGVAANVGACRHAGGRANETRAGIPSAVAACGGTWACSRTSSLPARSDARREATEAERARLAADLHAHVLPELRRAAAAAASAGAPPEMQVDLRRALEDVEQLMHQRQSIVLEQFGLVAALEWLAERTEERSALRVQLDLDGAVPGRPGGDRCRGRPRRVPNRAPRAGQRRPPRGRDDGDAPPVGRTDRAAARGRGRRRIDRDASRNPAAGASPTCGPPRPNPAARSGSSAARARESRRPGRSSWLRETTHRRARHSPIDRTAPRPDPALDRSRRDRQGVHSHARTHSTAASAVDRGRQGLAEYALILALIAIVAIVALIFLGPGQHDPVRVGIDLSLRGGAGSRRRARPTIPACFPPETVLTHILVVADPARSRAWYADVLGATVEREYGSSIVLRFGGTWLLLVEGGGPTDDKPTVALVPPDEPGSTRQPVHHPRRRLPRDVRAAPRPRRQVPHAAGHERRGDPLLPARSRRASLRAERVPPG